MEQVLVEEKDGDFYKGHTGNYLLVKFKSNEDVINQLVKVRIKEFTEHELIGRM